MVTRYQREEVLRIIESASDHKWQVVPVTSALCIFRNVRNQKPYLGRDWILVECQTCGIRAAGPVLYSEEKHEGAVMIPHCVWRDSFGAGEIVEWRPIWTIPLCDDVLMISIASVHLS